MLALRSDQNLFASASGLIGTIHGEKPVRHQGLAAWQKATADLPLGTSDQRSAVVPATTLARHAAILELLRTGELPAERAAAAAALAQIGQLLASPEPAELRLGICAAGRAQAAARPAIPKLAGLCSHEDPAIRGAAAEALGKIRQTAEIAVPDICRLLAEDDAGVLLNAVRALAAFGPFARPALPRLKELAKAPAEDRAALRRAAEDTIKAIVGDPPVKRAE
jgi:HEAT repeat protein